MPIILTVFPQRIFLPPPLEESLGALLQRLDEDRLGDLQRRRVRLPRLEVDRWKYVAVHRRIPESAETEIERKRQETSFINRAAAAAGMH